MNRPVRRRLPLSRWHRRHLIASVLVALVLWRGYAGASQAGVWFGLTRLSGSPLAGFSWTAHQISLACWRCNGTVILGTGAIHFDGSWRLGMNAVDADGRVTWRREVCVGGAGCE